jgi:hypothetical protein
VSAASPRPAALATHTQAVDHHGLLLLLLLRRGGIRRGGERWAALGIDRRVGRGEEGVEWEWERLYAQERAHVRVGAVVHQAVAEAHQRQELGGGGGGGGRSAVTRLYGHVPLAVVRAGHASTRAVRQAAFRKPRPDLQLGSPARPLEGGFVQSKHEGKQPFRATALLQLGCSFPSFAARRTQTFFRLLVFVCVLGPQTTVCVGLCGRVWRAALA